MIFSLEPRIKALILDMDGVLWRGDEPIGNLHTIFSRIEQAGLQIMFATNNALKPVAGYREKLNRFGLHINGNQIVNSTMAVCYLLQKEFPHGGPVYVVGSPGLQAYLAEHRFYQADEDVLAVVVGLDQSFTYEKLAHANRLIRSGARFIATNPDPTFPLPDEVAPGAGSIIAAIQTASQTTPVFAGKPSPTMYEMALKLLGLPPKQVLAVGDRLDTDIIGGHLAGCRTALVLSVIHQQADLENWSPQPDLIAPDLNTLLDQSTGNFNG
jgi:4-nitrophenyl phosphatase